MTEKKQNLTVKKALNDLLSGSITGIITKTVCAPLERVKIIQQVEVSKEYSHNKYNGIMGSFRTILKEEGAKALFKGNFANIIRIIPSYAFKFAFNDSIKLLIVKPGQNINKLTFTQLLISGSLAGFFQSSKY
jgi:hypothetical protein